MDMIVEAVNEDCHNVAPLGPSVQARDGAPSGGLYKTTRDSSLACCLNYNEDRTR